MILFVILSKQIPSNIFRSTFLHINIQSFFDLLQQFQSQQVQFPLKHLSFMNVCTCLQKQFTLKGKKCSLYIFVSLLFSIIDEVIYKGTEIVVLIIFLSCFRWQ